METKFFQLKKNLLRQGRNKFFKVLCALVSQLFFYVMDLAGDKIRYELLPLYERVKQER